MFLFFFTGKESGERLPEQGNLCHLHDVITFNMLLFLIAVHTHKIQIEERDLFLILQYITQIQTHSCHRDDGSTSAG